MNPRLPDVYQVQLGVEDKSPENKKVMIYREQGSMQGFVRPRKLPPHHQTGQPVVLKEGVTYLAIKIVRVLDFSSLSLSLSPLSGTESKNDFL